MAKGESAAEGCVVKSVILLVKLFLVVVVLAFIYMGYIYVFGGAGQAPDWILKGYTNEHYRAGEKHGTKGEYELAIHEFTQAMTTEPDNEAMVQDCRLNIAACYERLASQLEPLTYIESDEGYEAARKQEEAYQRALEQYNILLQENPQNRDIQTRRNLLLMRRG